MIALRDEARRDLGRAADLILAVLGRTEIEDDSEHARATAGALLLAEALQDLRLMRQGTVETKRT